MGGGDDSVEDGDDNDDGAAVAKRIDLTPERTRTTRRRRSIVDFFFFCHCMDSSSFDSAESSSEQQASSPSTPVRSSAVRPIATPTTPTPTTTTTTSSAALFSPRPLGDADDATSLFSPRAGLTELSDKSAVKQRRDSVRVQLHLERGRTHWRHVLVVVLLSLFCVALPTSIAAFVLVGLFRPAVPASCDDALSSWVVVVAVFNVVAILCLVPWLVKPGRPARYVGVAALWLFGGVQIGLIIWGALIWVSGSPPAKCVAAYGGRSSGLGLMATILFAFSVAMWLTTCLGLLGNSINAKLRNTEIELGVTPARELSGESDRDRWERKQRERNESKQTKVAVVPTAAAATAATAAKTAAPSVAAKESDSGETDSEGTSEETDSEETDSEETDSEETEGTSEESSEESEESEGQDSSEESEEDEEESDENTSEDEEDVDGSSSTETTSTES